MNRPTSAGPLSAGLVGLVFLAAGLLKIWDPGAFAVAIVRLQAVPRALVGPSAILLPWIEVAAGAALLIGPWRPAGRLVAGALLAAFTIVLAVALLRGSASTCGCFGVDGGVWARLDVALFRNLLLGALLALSCRRSAPASPASARSG
jgi:putative oxidoreductase